MVVLVIKEPGELSDLELRLLKNKIDYQYKVDSGEYGLQPPHLIVDGVPLDETRSFKWIEGCKEYE